VLKDIEYEDDHQERIVGIQGAVTKSRSAMECHFGKGDQAHPNPVFNLYINSATNIG
jgi:hypothetical protein